MRLQLCFSILPFHRQKNRNSMNSTVPTMLGGAFEVSRKKYLDETMSIPQLLSGHTSTLKPVHDLIGYTTIDSTFTKLAGRNWSLRSSIVPFLSAMSKQDTIQRYTIYVSRSRAARTFSYLLERVSVKVVNIHALWYIHTWASTTIWIFCLQTAVYKLCSIVSCSIADLNKILDNKLEDSLQLPLSPMDFC